MANPAPNTAIEADGALGDPSQIAPDEDSAAASPKAVSTPVATGYPSIAIYDTARQATDADAHPSPETLRKYGLSDWTRYTIVTFHVFKYASYQEYLDAKRIGPLGAPSGTFELSFEPLGRNELKPELTKVASILGSTPLMKEVVFLPDVALKKTRSAKFGLAIYDIGQQVYSNGERTRTPNIRIHGGGAYYSDQCATSPVQEYKNSGGNQPGVASSELLALEGYFCRVLGISATAPRAFILLPPKTLAPKS